MKLGGGMRRRRWVDSEERGTGDARLMGRRMGRPAAPVRVRRAGRWAERGDERVDGLEANQGAALVAAVLGSTSARVRNR